jgi:hypothetical protein
MAQQTAVEWLEQALLRPSNGMTLLSNGFIKELFVKAKEMEKQQIEKAHGGDRSYLQDDGSWKTINGEQYYTETYGNNTKNK